MNYRQSYPAQSRIREEPRTVNILQNSIHRIKNTISNIQGVTGIKLESEYLGDSRIPLSNERNLQMRSGRAQASDFMLQLKELIRLEVAKASSVLSNEDVSQRQARSQQSRLNQQNKITINISNKQTKYNLKHGVQFSGMLEARDVVMEHEFNFNLHFSLQDMRREDYSFMKDSFLLLEKQVKSFLVESVSNIVSADFRNILQGKLEGKEAKAHASKNMMLNIHSIFRQTLRAFKMMTTNYPETASKIDLKQLQTTLIIKIDQILTNI